MDGMNFRMLLMQCLRIEEVRAAKYSLIKGPTIMYALHPVVAKDGPVHPHYLVLRKTEKKPLLHQDVNNTRAGTRVQQKQFSDCCLPSRPRFN